MINYYYLSNQIMTEITININVKKIKLVVMVKYSSIKDIDNILKDSILKIVNKFTEDNNYDENKRIIKEVYKKEIIDVIYDFSLEDQMTLYSKAELIEILTLNLIMKDINENLNDKITQDLIKQMPYKDKVKYLRFKTNKLVKSLTDESLSKNKNKIAQLIGIFI